MCHTESKYNSNSQNQKLNITDEQRLFIFCETDDNLCALMAANSGRGGDRALLRAARLELERRTELKKALQALALAAVQR